MRKPHPTRSLLLVLLVLGTTAGAFAQHGGPPGGGPPPGGGGIGPGGPGGGPPPRGGDAPGGGGRYGPQLGPPGRWWNDKRMATRLNLTADQQHKMDAVFAAARPRLVELYNNLEREEDRLSGMSSKELQDEARVYAAIDRVTRARAEVEKENVHVLIQLRALLDPGQLSALDKQTRQ